jgi:hypothetical protein
VVPPSAAKLNRAAKFFGHRSDRAATRSDQIDRLPIEAPCVIDGPINGESFLAYVEQVLVPALKPGDIVIIDNLSTREKP